tara:strand:+ start:2545 stop:3015 length:471 start_codon:yes stop_codon:yes gene_type:complete
MTGADPAVEAAQRAWVDRDAAENDLHRHQPVLSIMDGSIRGCQCSDRVFYRGREDWGSHLAGVCSGYMVAGAREALAPVRALHYRIDIAATSCVEECEVHEDECPLDVKVPVCRECYRIAEEADLYFSERPGWHEPVAWPCATARLVYTAEELEGK